MARPRSRGLPLELRGLDVDAECHLAAGRAVSEGTFAAVEAADAVSLGALGDPRAQEPGDRRPLDLVILWEGTEGLRSPLGGRFRHGSAPDLAGQGPQGWSSSIPGCQEGARALGAAIVAVVKAGERGQDLGGALPIREAAAAIARRLHASPGRWMGRGTFNPTEGQPRLSGVGDVSPMRGPWPMERPLRGAAPVGPSRPRGRSPVSVPAAGDRPWSHRPDPPGPDGPT